MVTNMARQTTLHITQMTCTTCAGSVEKALSGVPGVSKASVNFAAEKATVEYDPSVTSEAALTKAVESAGYGVATSEVTLGLVGMSCVTCAGTIEEALKAVDGVISVAVNFATEKATVRYSPDRC
jgi:Cu+-exporting ATPase